jgi:parvulin-like peptidyl-prolyl isomerase
MRKLLPLVLLGALVASGCSTLATPPAATVNGAEISADSITDELRTIKGNADYRKAIEQSFGGSTTGAGKGTFDSAFAAQILSLRVYYTLLEQELEERGVELTEDDLLAARETVEQQVNSVAEEPGTDVFGSFPKAYRDRLARQEALVAKVQQALSGESGDAEAFFEENKEQFEQACVSHILVSSETRSPEEALTAAQAIKARLDAGEDFAAVAAAESEDPGSAANGGDLGQCFDRTASLVPEFLDAAFEQPVGEVSEPVQTQFGYHLILVRSRETPAFEDVEQQVQAMLQSQSTDSVTKLLVEVACDGDVDVSPRFGTWDTSPCGDAGRPARVTPPAQASTTTVVPEG